MGCHFLLQGIFLTQGLNLGLPHCRQIHFGLNHQGSIELLKSLEFPKKWEVSFVMLMRTTPKDGDWLLGETTVIGWLELSVSPSWLLGRRKGLEVKSVTFDCWLNYSCLCDAAAAAAAAAKSLQSCPILCDPIAGSPSGSSVHGIFQAKVLECVAIAYSDLCNESSSKNPKGRDLENLQVDKHLKRSEEVAWWRSSMPFPHTLPYASLPSGCFQVTYSVISWSNSK